MISYSVQELATAEVRKKDEELMKTAMNEASLGKLSVCIPLGHITFLGVSHTLGHSLGHTLGHSLGHSLGRTLGHSLGHTLGHSLFCI